MMFEFSQSDILRRDGFEEFCKNMRSKSSGNLPVLSHNVYLIQTMDMDGNITDEKYCMNIMTNAGFKSFYLDDNNSTWSSTTFSVTLGSGDTNPSVTDTTLETPALNGTYSDIKNSLSRYPAYYDAQSGMIIFYSIIGSAVFDYNITNVTEDEDIREVGIRYTAISPLMTRTLIYDKNGEKSSIKKKLNEKLTVTVFFSISIKASIINSMYNRGVYFVGELNEFLYYQRERSGYCAMWFSTSYGLGPLRHWYVSSGVTFPNFSKALRDIGGTSTTTNTPFKGGGASDLGNGVYKSERYLSNVHVIQNKYDYISTIILADQGASGDTNVSGGNNGELGVGRSHFMILEESDKLSEPETLVCNDVYTDTINTSSVAMAFGRAYNDYAYPSLGNMSDYKTGVYVYSLPTGRSNYGVLPCVDFNLLQSRMYNFQTNEWDIEDSIKNSPQAYYNNSFVVPANIWIKGPEGKGISVRVWVNTRPDIKIKGFNSYRSVSLAATDAYWDSSTWEQIPDSTNIIDDSRNLGKKRYYICLSGDDLILDPIRDQEVHEILSNTEPFSISGSTPIPVIHRTNGNSYKMLSSDENRWIMTEHTLFYLDESDQYQKIRIAEDVVGGSRKNGTNYDTDVFQWHPYLRFATDDYLVIVNGGVSLYNTTDNSVHYQYQCIRVYDVEKCKTQYILGGDETTNASCFTDLQFEFTETDSKADRRQILYSWSSKGYLVGHMNVTGCTKVGYLKLYPNDEDEITPTVTMIEGGTHAWALDGTSYMVYKDANVANHFHIYDMASGTEVNTFDIPGEYTFSSLTGFSHYVYVRVSKNNVYSTYLYKINENLLVYLSDHTGSTLSYGSTVTTYAPSSSEYYGEEFPKICNEHMMIACYAEQTRRGTSTYPCYIYTDTDPENPVLMSNRISATYRATMENYMIPSNAKIMYTKDKKHLLLLSSPTFPNVNYTNSYCVLDVGYLYNGNVALNIPDYHWGIPDVSGNDYCSGSITTFNNGIVVHYYNGEIIWYPLERWLPHQVTGTTRTIQSYNNPKALSGKRYKLWISNRDDVTEYPTE